MDTHTCPNCSSTSLVTCHDCVDFGAHEGNCHHDDIDYAMQSDRQLYEAALEGNDHAASILDDRNRNLGRGEYDAPDVIRYDPAGNTWTG